MDAVATQQRIDAIDWYHEFDFGNGLRSRTKAHELDGHRRVWEFIRRHLDAHDLCGKSVLDIGCWDGYWSFEAERRGAARVLATDDVSQNWSGGTGAHLARELLGSSVEIDLNRSVYDLKHIGRTFDVILFLGVYYHLHAPFPAFAQIRHCCHPGTVVLVEGPITHGLPDGAALYNYPDHTCEWMPTLGALRMIAEAAYFDVAAADLLDAVPAPVAPANGRIGWRTRLRMCQEALGGKRAPILERAAALAPPTRSPRESGNRVFLTLKPSAAENPLHAYPPPYGLAAYDPRFDKK